MGFWETLLAYAPTAREGDWISQREGAEPALEESHDIPGLYSLFGSGGGGGNRPFLVLRLSGTSQRTSRDHFWLAG